MSDMAMSVMECELIVNRPICLGIYHAIVIFFIAYLFTTI